jgi:hypothetical protein
MSVILALRRLRQEDFEVKARLGNTLAQNQTKTKQKERKKGRKEGKKERK